MRIKCSKRGLTFSFAENDTFRAGTKYRYIIDREKEEVILLPDSNGKYRLSKKGVQQKPLVDLRNKEIREMISFSKYMEIEISEDKIIVHIIRKEVNTEGLNDREIASLFDHDTVSFEIPKEELLHCNQA